MLRNKMNDAKSLFKQVNNAQNAATQIASYNQFLEKLKEVEEYSNSCYKIYISLNNYDSRFGNLDFRELIDKTENMSTALSEGEILRKSQLNEFSDQIQNQENILREQWKKFASEKSISIVSTLKSIKGLFDDSERITNMIKRLETAKDRWPLDGDSLNKFEKDLADGKAIIQELNAGEEIQRFLTLVAMQQATISDINSDILKWINERNFATKIKLSFIS